MIGYVVLGTNDLARAAAFYDELLAEMGVTRQMEFGERGYAWAAAMDKPMLCIMKPYYGQPATVGNGVMAGIAAETCNHDVIESNPVRCADPAAAERMVQAILAAKDDDEDDAEDDGDPAYAYTPQALYAAARSVTDWLALKPNLRVASTAKLHRCDGLVLALGSLLAGSTLLIYDDLDVDGDTLVVGRPGDPDIIGAAVVLLVVVSRFGRRLPDAELEQLVYRSAGREGA